MKAHACRLVVKIGSAVLCSNGKIKDSLVASVAADVCNLRANKIEVIIICSGAVSSGKGKFLKGKLSGLSNAGGAIKEQTRDYTKLLADQIFAAVGQAEVICAFKTEFERRSLSVGQVLVTRADFASQRRYESIRNVTDGMLANDVIPIFNENDVLVPEDLDFGDNDELAAIIAASMAADWLAMLTAAPGVYLATPTDKEFQVLHEIADVQHARTLVGNGKSPVGRGGIQSKLHIAGLVTGLGINMWVLDGRVEGILSAAFVEQSRIGTVIRSQEKRVKSFKGWLAMAAQAKGELTVSAFCADRLRIGESCSVLMIGVESCVGHFEKGDVITVSSQNGVVLARGKVRMDSKTINELMRQRELSQGDVDFSGLEVIHYDQLALAPQDA
jgi:glutamate 5-kinase